MDRKNLLLHQAYNLKSATFTGVWVRFPPPAPTLQTQQAPEQFQGLLGLNELPVSDPRTFLGLPVGVYLNKYRSHDDE